MWLWGEFKVNGPKPLRAAVDLIAGRFYCSCRSRNRPCTHALSLVMILNNQAERITVGEAPDWLADYKPTAGEVAKPAPVKSLEPHPPTGSWAEKLGKRHTLMQEGIADLELRLIDILDRGLADTNTLGAAFWDATAKRLTDAKLPGLGNRVRSLARVEHPNLDQQLRIIGDLYLVVRSWQNQAALSPKQQDELYQVCGVNLKKEEVTARPPRNDHWLVMGQTQGTDDRLRYRRVWLRGEGVKRYALLLDFAFGEQAFERTWPLASSWQGGVHYYPGSYPQRAIFPHPSPGGRPYEGLLGYPHYQAMLHDYERALALTPWLGQYPVYLAEVIPYRKDQQCYLVDTEDRPLPISPGYSNFYTLLAASGGSPISVFAEFDGQYLLPLSMFNAMGLLAV